MAQVSQSINSVAYTWISYCFIAKTMVMYKFSQGSKKLRISGTFSPKTYFETPPTSHSKRVVSLSIFSTLQILFTEDDMLRDAVERIK